MEWSNIFFKNNLYFYYAIIEHIRLEKNSEEVLPPPKQKQKKQKINVGLIKYKPPSLQSTLVLCKIVRQWWSR